MWYGIEGPANVQTGHIYIVTCRDVFSSKVCYLHKVHLRSTLATVRELRWVEGRFDLREDSVERHNLQDFGNRSDEGNGAFPIAGGLGFPRLI